MLLKNKALAFYAILVITIGFIIQLLINPCLNYHLQQPAFLWGEIFYKPYLIYPGGITDYLTLFLSQLFYFKWIGTFIIITISISISILIYQLSKIARKKIPFELFFLSMPLILLTTLELNYKYQLQAPIKILLALLTVYLIFKLKNENLKNIIIFISLLILYYIAGGISLLLYSICLIIIFLSKKLSKSTFVKTITLITLTAIIPYLSYRYVFLISLNNAYLKIFPDTPLFLQYKPIVIDYIYFAIAPIILIISNFKFAFIDKFEIKEISTKNILKPSLQIIVLVIVAYSLMHLNYNKKTKQQVEIDYYAYNEDWAKIIRNVKYDGQFDIMNLFQLNRAQSHLNTLTDNLFVYPQLIGSESLFPDVYTTGQITIPASDLYFDLGYIGNSQRWIYEAQTLMPYNPRVLKRLIINYIITKNYIAADKYLQIFNKNLLYKEWTSKYINLVKDTTLIAKDKFILEKRNFNPSDSIISDEPNAKLKVLLQKNKENKMAYDYLQCFYILNHQTGDFIQRLNDIQLAGYQQLPTIFEQTIELFNLKTGTVANLPEKWRVNEKTKANFYNFNKTFAQYKGNREAAQNELYQSFGNTFWYYILYDSPKITNAKIESRPLEY